MKESIFLETIMIVNRYLHYNNQHYFREDGFQNQRQELVLDQEWLEEQLGT